MNKLEFSAVRALYQHRGSLSLRTQARERQEARQMARTVYAANYKPKSLQELKGKHISLLLDVWAGRVPDPATGKQQALSPGVQAIRATTLRKLAKFGGKPGLVPKKNATAGLPARERVPGGNIAWQTDRVQLEAMGSHHCQLVLRACEEFGVRRSEGFLLDARTAVQGDVLCLTRTKGKVPREVPIRTEAQRQLLAEIREVNRTTPQGTLIAGASLRESLNDLKREMAAVGMTKAHGLRHSYAQRRYEELTGWPCGKAREGGWPAGFFLNEEHAAQDLAARAVVAAELGHGRVSVTSIYLGRTG